MEEDGEVLAQTRREMETKKASSSAAAIPALTMGQGGTTAKRNKYIKTSTTVDEETATDYWYARPK
eukprot:15627645-Heterocapsa_arctica.AAC.1